MAYIVNIATYEIIKQKLKIPIPSISFKAVFGDDNIPIHIINLPHQRCESKIPRMITDLEDN